MEKILCGCPFTTLRSSILRGNSVDMCSPKVPYFGIVLKPALTSKMTSSLLLISFEPPLLGGGMNQLPSRTLEATQSHNIKRTDELTLNSSKRYRMTTHGLRRF